MYKQYILKGKLLLLICSIVKIDNRNITLTWAIILDQKLNILALILNRESTFLELYECSFISLLYHVHPLLSTIQLLQEFFFPLLK